MIEIKITGDTAADVLEQLRGLTQPEYNVFKGPLPSSSGLAAAISLGTDQFGKTVVARYDAPPGAALSKSSDAGQTAKPEFVTAQQQQQYAESITSIPSHPSGFTAAEIADPVPPAPPVNPFSAMQHAIDSTTPRPPTLGDIAGPLALANNGWPLPPPAAAGPTERDSRGLPWDARIHTQVRSKLQNGQWRAKRGVDAALLAQVEAELGAVSAIPPPPGAVVVPPPPIPTGPNPFAGFIEWLTPHVSAQRLTYQQVQDTIVKHGVPAIPMLEHRHDVIAAVRTELEGLIKP